MRLIALAAALLLTACPGTHGGGVPVSVYGAAFDDAGGPAFDPAGPWFVIDFAQGIVVFRGHVGGELGAVGTLTGMPLFPPLQGGAGTFRVWHLGTGEEMDLDPDGEIPPEVLAVIPYSVRVRLGIGK